MYFIDLAPRRADIHHYFKMFSSNFLLLYLLLRLMSPLSARRLVLDDSRQAHNYTELHLRLVEDQINNYKPALDSIDTRPTQSLDGDWDFLLDKDGRGFESTFYAWPMRSNNNVTMDDVYSMPVPSAFNEITSNKTVRNHIGWMWYQRLVESVAFGHSSRLVLQFESVNYLALVWVRAREKGQEKTGKTKVHLLGSHVGGYLPFNFELTGLQPPYLITVAVSNILNQDTIPSGQLKDLSRETGRSVSLFEPDFDFFHFAGILGQVRLIGLPAQYLANVQLYPPTATRAECCSSEFSLKVCLGGLIADKTNQVSLDIKLDLAVDSSRLDRLAEATFVEQLSAGRACFSPVFHLDELKPSWLWLPARGRANHMATLVQATIELLDSAGSVSDRMSVRTDIRADTRQPLQGFGMHHEQLFSGRTMSRPAMAKDMNLLKQLGATLIRTSHYPYSREYLDLCDLHGIQVVAESAAVGLRSFGPHKLRLHKQLMREMLVRDHAHPSILMWSVANEPQSQLEPARGYFEALTDFMRTELAEFTLGAGRGLTAAIAQSHRDDKVAHTLDVIMVNRYFGWYDFTGVLEAIEQPLTTSLAGWRAKHPDKGLLLSEFGAEALAGFHSLSGELFSEEFQRDLLLEYERVIGKLLASQEGGNGTGGGSGSVELMGAMLWNFADFSTHNSLERPRGNQKGVLTRDRRPKLSAHAIRCTYLGRLDSRAPGGALGGARDFGHEWGACAAPS